MIAPAELADAARQSLPYAATRVRAGAKPGKSTAGPACTKANHAYKLIREQLAAVDSTKTNYSNGGGTYSYLLDAHPPFQIDGNFGALSTAKPGEDRYVIHLLPALAPDWKNGEFKVFRASGGMEIDLAWQNGKAVSTVLHPASPETWRIRPPRGQRIANLRSPKGSARLRPSGDGAVEVSLTRAAFSIQLAHAS